MSTAYTDMDVIVVYKVSPSKRRPNGKTFISKKKKNGAQFNISLGDVVTYQYLSKSSVGIPRQPILLRKKDDQL
jgi:hypothetical protein